MDPGMGAVIRQVSWSGLLGLKWSGGLWMFLENIELIPPDVIHPPTR